MSIVKKYKLNKPVMLSYHDGRDQHDATYHPEDADYILECDGSTIWVVLGDKRMETITMANAIDIWLEQGKIELC